MKLIRLYRTHRRFFAIFFGIKALVVLSLFATGCFPASEQPEEEQPEIAAWFNGNPVLMEDLLVNLKVFLVDRGMDPPDSPEAMEGVVRECLMDMAQDVVLLTGAAELGISPEFSELDEQTFVYDQTEFPEGFQALENELLDWRTRVDNRLRMLSTASQVAEKLAQDIDVTEEEIEEEYNLSKDKWIKPVELDIRIIRVNDFDLARDIDKKIRRGWNFVKLAENYSNYRGAGARGRVIRMVISEFPLKHQPELIPLKAGRSSPVLTSREGFYIYKVESVYAEQVLPLQEVQDSIKKELFSRKSSRRYRDWIRTRVADVKIKLGTPVPFEKEK